MVAGQDSRTNDRAIGNRLKSWADRMPSLAGWLLPTTLTIPEGAVSPSRAPGPITTTVTTLTTPEEAVSCDSEQMAASRSRVTTLTTPEEAVSLAA
jgi:hypothetical protein